MQTRTRFSQRAILLILILLTASAMALAKNPRFGVSGHSVGWGGSCDPEHNKILAGSLVFVNVCNRADQPKEARSPGWPEGYVLEAALDLPSKTQFAATPGLIERLRPTPYLGSATRGELRRLRTGDLVNVDVGWLNVKSFTLRIPSDLVAHGVTLRARCDKGGTTRYSDILDPFQVIATCDRSDTARIVAGEVFLAYQTEDDARVLEIADSMLACGLTDAAAWKWAMGVAHGLNQLDKEMAYLDRMYEDFGVTWFAGFADLQLNRNGVRNPREQELYRQVRTHIQQMINQQQQH